MTSPRSWTNFLVNTFPLLFSISGQLSFIVCAISEMAMLGRESHSQLKSFNRLNRLTSAVPYLQENGQECVNKCGVSVCACLTGWSVRLLSWSDVHELYKLKELYGFGHGFLFRMAQLVGGAMRVMHSQILVKVDRTEN